jgi:lysozyme
MNLQDAKTAGIVFVYWKATQGTVMVDPTFHDGWDTLKSDGIIRGAYHFLTGGAAKEQADNFVRTVGKLDPADLPPAVDVEANPQGPSATRDDVTTWIETVEQQLGIRPIIVSGSYLRILEGPSATGKLVKYPIWILRYGPTPTLPPGWERWTFWQFTDGVLGPEPHFVPGVGNCDISKFNGTVDELRAFISQSHLSGGR